MVFVGIDQSITSSGLVVINDKGEILETRLIETKSKIKKVEVSYEERFDFILTTIYEIISKYKDFFIFIEGISYHSISQRSYQQGALHWLIVVMCYKNNFKYSVVAPTANKKFMTGKGNAKKEDMIYHVKNKYDIDFKSSDLCDAFSLAQYGREMLERGI